MQNSSVTGSYTGSGAAQDINIGFKPNKVEIFNYSDADFQSFHINGMPDASAGKIKDTGVGTTDISKVTSNGITLSNYGFTVGSDSDLNESGKTFYYRASR